MMDSSQKKGYAVDKNLVLAGFFYLLLAGFGEVL